MSLYCPEAIDARRSASGQMGLEVRPSETNVTPMMPLPHCVYILFSRRDLLLYTGYTTSIEERVKNHNQGKTKSTASRRPLELIFCEFYVFEADARKREMYFKTTAGKKAIKLMLGGTLLKFGYNRTAGIAVINEDESDDNL